MAGWRIAITAPEAMAALLSDALEPLLDAVSVFELDEDAPAEGEAADAAPARTLALPKALGPATVAHRAGALWRIEGYSAAKPERPALAAAVEVAAAVAGVTPTPILVIEPLPATNWVAETAAAFPPLSIGRVFLHGSHVLERPVGRVRLRIDAGIAFGSGEHATTAGCLAALQGCLKRRPRPRSVLDMGCGTGVLAMAAAALSPLKGARRRGGAAVRAVDIDEDAAAVAARNARDNGLGGAIGCARSVGYRHRRVREAAPYDLILANILARPLAMLAPALRRHLARRGRAVLSGLLPWQEAAVIAAHRRQGLRLVQRIRREGWSVLVLARG